MMFAHMLALDLKQPDPLAMMERMSEATFRRWMAFYLIKSGKFEDDSTPSYEEQVQMLARSSGG